MALDQTFDSIPIKNIANAKDVVAAIKKTEDKVSNIFYISSCILYSTKMIWKKCTRIFKIIC